VPATERLHVVLGLAVVIALVLSGISPYERATWLMEVAPVLIGLPILVFTYHRFRFTGLLYVLMASHAIVLIVGGHYTYARVPLGDWAQQAFSLGRNPYDKLGHFMQGFVPALIAREIFLRGGFVTGGRMIAFLGICVAMTVSGFYELLEWSAALAFGQGAEEFLGTQGDPWDTQSDMFMALIGAFVALASLSGLLDRQIANRVASR
jgi:putative membrane protein